MRTVALLFWLILLSVSLQARHLDYDTLHKMPKSVEKDYYIWRYIQSPKCTKTEAKKLIKEAFRINGKLSKAYTKNTQLKAPSIKRKAQHKPSKKETKKYKQNISITNKILKSKEPIKEWNKLSTKKKIFVYNHAGKDGRKALDHPIPPALFKEFTKHYSFNDSIYRIMSEKPKYFTEMLMSQPDEKNKISYNSLTKIAFKALYLGKPKIAERYFEIASQKAQQREDLDKALFWAYLSSKNRSYLSKLIQSFDINVYTLSARDILHLKYPKTITPKLPNRKNSDKKLSDPIHWAHLKRQIFSKKYNLKKLASKYKYSDAIGYYTYIMAKASKEKDQYFPMPYRDILRKLPKSRQAILYAIARQESRFVPTSISASYALGMMQFMPFLVRHIAKQRGEKVDYDSMFDPRKALIYANEHMNYLNKWLQHPLFVAYAYNAGIGYTRRMLKKKFMFNGKGSYEPYISMEILDNDQARRYGKHVLTNYVIYMNKLGIPTRITDLLKTLHLPKKSDKFRKRSRQNG